MKKVLISFLTIILCVILVSCGKNNESTKSSSEKNSIEENNNKDDKLEEKEKQSENNDTINNKDKNNEDKKASNNKGTYNKEILDEFKNLATLLGEFGKKTMDVTTDGAISKQEEKEVLETVTKISNIVENIENLNKESTDKEFKTLTNSFVENMKLYSENFVEGLNKDPGKLTSATQYFNEAGNLASKAIMRAMELN